MRRCIVGLAAALIAMAVSTGSALASDLTVAKPTDLACGEHATYHTIQAAVTAAKPGDTIHVCPGLYQERVVIGPGKDNLKLVSVKQWQAAIQFPSSAPPSGQPDAVVRISGAHNVLVQLFTIEGPWSDTSGCPQTPSAAHDGVRVDSGGSAIIDTNHITQIEDNTQALRGCQDGVAVLVGHSSEGTTGSAEVKNNTIDKYQKNGPTIDGAGSSGNVHDNKIDGGGDNNLIAKNGVQIGRDATAQVQHNQVFNNYYSGIGPPPPQDAPDDNDATGILVFSVTGGVTVNANTLYLDDLGFDLGTASKVLISNNITNSNTFDGLRAESDTSSNTFQGNQSSSNGTHDCHDDSHGTGTATTANTWTGNAGVTQTPAGICKPPS